MKKLAPKDLPGIHAAHDKNAKGWRVDIADHTLRLEGDGTVALKQAIAYRMAFTWNMAEGIPTAALEAGVVREFYAAGEELLALLKEKSWILTEEDGKAAALVARMRTALEAHDFQPVACDCRIASGKK